MLAASGGGANSRRFGNYNEEVSHFPAKRIFYAAAVSVDGGGDDHSFSFSTHATEWAWDYGADGERRAAFITLMSGRYLSSQRPKVAPSAVKTRPTAARRRVPPAEQHAVVPVLSLP